MCTSNTELQFCTCVEGDIYEVKDIYIWTLRSHVGSKESMIRGKIMKSTEDFEKESLQKIFYQNLMMEIFSILNIFRRKEIRLTLASIPKTGQNINIFH